MGHSKGTQWGLHWCLALLWPGHYGQFLAHELSTLLSYLNLISRLISIVSPAWVTKLFTEKEPVANSERKKGLQLHPKLVFRQHFCSPPMINLLSWWDRTKFKSVWTWRESFCCHSVSYGVQFQSPDGCISLLFDWNHFVLSQISRLMCSFVLHNETVYYQLWFNRLQPV